jgi:hypothetical protein
VGEIQKGHRYYHCTSAKCRGTWYREDKIAVWQEFADAFRIMQAETEAVDLLRKALKEVTKTGTGGVEDEIRDLRQSYNKIEAKLLQIYDDRLSGIFNTEICRKKMTELEQQQQSIKTKIELLERDAHKVLKGGLDILDLGEQVTRKVEGFNLEQKRRLLMIMMEDAEAKDGKVSYKISFRISLMFELSRGKHTSELRI